MLKSTRLINNINMQEPIVEAYKTIRTNIQFSSLDKSVQLLMVTSANPEEGKSTTICNLAITLAQSEKKVLLIDCDLRKPAIHRAFNILNVKGLTNILVENLDYSLILNEVGIPCLDVITSGPKPPNPSELLGSSRMKLFLNQLKKEYDFVILDTPPVLPVTDATVLSQMVDGVILVTRYGRTTYESIIKAKENLERVKANLLGTVINDTPITGQHGSYYYYYSNDTEEKNKRRSSRKITSHSETNKINFFNNTKQGSK